MRGFEAGARGPWSCRIQRVMQTARRTEGPATVADSSCGPCLLGSHLICPAPREWMGPRLASNQRRVATAVTSPPGPIRASVLLGDSLRQAWEKQAVRCELPFGEGPRARSRSQAPSPRPGSPEGPRAENRPVGGGPLPSPASEETAAPPAS